MTIPPKLICRQGARLPGYAHTKKRAKELAQEVDRLNRTVAELAAVGIAEFALGDDRIEALGHLHRAAGQGPQLFGPRRALVPAGQQDRGDSLRLQRRGQSISPQLLRSVFSSEVLKQICSGRARRIDVIETL